MHWPGLELIEEGVEVWGVEDASEEEIRQSLSAALLKGLAAGMDDFNDHTAGTLGEFLGSYVFAVNDVLGCPGVLADGVSECTVSGPDWPLDDPLGSYWLHGDVTHPAVRAVTPVYPAADALEGNLLTDCEREDWGDAMGAAFVLHVWSDDAFGIAWPAPPTTLGEYEPAGVSQADLLPGAGTQVSLALEAFRDLPEPGEEEGSLHPFADATGLGQFLADAVGATTSISIPHQAEESCDDRYRTAFGDVGEEYLRCKDECQALASADSERQTLVSTAGGWDNLTPTTTLLGLDPSNLVHQLAASGAFLSLLGDCEDTCPSAERDLRDAWSRACRDSLTVCPTSTTCTHPTTITLPHPRARLG